ncbi:hypothetical protein [Nocardia wallacei]|uniref:hypothetical protein n=1 Tax=Nocardia wallacei TaxID=480035 RepID=UPI002457BB47|nr:hypothetical protein [Nocardia wallacei]
MSVRTRVDAPRRESSRRAAKTAEQRAAQVMPRRGEKAAPQRVEQAERVKSGAAQRAYARRRNRVQGGGLPPLPGRAASAMAGRLPFVTGIIALLAGGLMVTLLLTTHAAEDSYQLGDARRINRQLSDERAALQREVAAADSAPELANRARELGMIPAKDPSRLLIAPDGTITVIGKETPEQGAPAPPLNTTPSASPAVPKLVQAQGERLVPVTTTPTPGTNQPAGTSPAAGTNPGAGANPDAGANQAPEANQAPVAGQGTAPEDAAATPTQAGGNQEQQAPAEPAPAQLPAAPAAGSPVGADQAPAAGDPVASDQSAGQSAGSVPGQTVPASGPLDRAVPVPGTSTDSANSAPAASGTSPGAEAVVGQQGPAVAGAPEAESVESPAAGGAVR